VLAILDDKNFAQIFSPGSRPEVPIVGRIPRAGAEPLAVAGQVDRLTVTDDAVLIADYKTDRVVPSHFDDVPQPYIAQLALYRAVLARIYPEKLIRAALIFSNGPSLIAVRENAMDAALAEVLRRHIAPSF
jgi:ATP-dependent helicase/nuclease subunit A